jgi:hypothetical protein
VTISLNDDLIEYEGLTSLQVIYNIFRQRPSELLFKEASKKNVGTELLRKYELENKKFEKLALFEAQKTMPFESVWNYYLEINNMPSDLEIIKEIKKYETKVLEKRS